MYSAEDELLATLANLLGLIVLLDKLVVVLDNLDVLAEIAKKIVQKVIECVLQISVVQKVLIRIWIQFQHSSVRHFYFHH